MNENDDKLKEEPKKGLYSYSADDEEFSNIAKIQDNRKVYNENYQYEYTDEISDKGSIPNNVNVNKKDLTFILCIVAGCLNFIFGFLFVIFNFNSFIGGVSFIGRSGIFSDYSTDIMLVSLILFVLFIAGFVFIYLYRQSKILGMLGIIVCGVVCLMCLFIESIIVLVQFVLYTIAIILFFNNYAKERKLSY